MPYKTGAWGEQAKLRNEKRLEYFRKYVRNKNGQNEDEDSIGHKGEKFAVQLLNGSNRIRKIYDLEWNGKRIDVKTSHLIRTKTGNAYRFCLEKQRGKVDYFLCLCVNNDLVEKVYFIPDREVVSNGIGIGVHHSKYDRFLIKRKAGEI